MNKIITILFLVLFTSSVFAAKLYTGGEKYEQDKVVALTLTLNGKMIEWVYKENIGQCLKSKRIAQREMDSTNSAKGARVIFACKILVADLEEDSQTKYGMRIIKVHSGA